MGKRCLVFMLFLFCLVFTAKLEAQPGAKEQVLDIMAMKIPDTSKFQLLITKANNAANIPDPQTLIYTSAAATLAESINAFTARIQVNEINGKYFTNVFKYDSALVFFEKNLQLSLDANDEQQIAQSYKKMGELKYNTGAFSDAIAYHEQALMIYEKLRDSNGIAGTYNAMGSNYTRLNQPSKTIELLQKAILIAKRSGQKQLLARLYNTIGSAYADVNNDSLVLKYQQEALAIYSELKDMEGLINTSVILGQLYNKRKSYPEAEKYYAAGIAYAKQLNSVRDLGLLYYNLGLVYYNMNNKDKASNILDTSIQYAILSGDKLVLSKAYRQKSYIFYDKENYKSGYEYYKLYSTINDSIYSINMQSNMAEMQRRYETEKNERRQQQEHFENVKRTYWIVGSLLFSIAAILLITSWYKRQKLHEERRFHQAIIAQQDLATKAVIEAEENERKRIAGDLHDGVGQMMSAAKMNLSSFESKAIFRSDEERQSFDKIITLVDDSCTEVRNVSHNMMPNALLKSGLASAVKEFIEKIDSRKLKVNLHAEGLNERLDRNVETVLYRVIQECVNNVIKHSGANHLDISLIKDTEGISATIEDNGIGFDIKQKDKFDGIGLKNIETRISYLKGSIDFDSRPGRGTLVAIHVPI